MAQFGIHAIVGLWLCSLIPFFLPFIKRRSFLYGLYWGCVFPDLDVYPEAVAFILGVEWAPALHRTYLHSIITATAIGCMFHVIELLKKKSVVNIQKESLLEGKERKRKMNYSAFGLGLFFGCSVHILLDILLWFSQLEFAWPLNLFTSLKVEPVNIWADTKVPEIFTTVLTVTEIFTMGLFFTMLRWYTNKKLRAFQATRAAQEVLSSESDEVSTVHSVETDVFYFGGLKYKPLHLLWVELLHYIYTALLLISMWVVSASTLFFMVFVTLLFVSVPTFYFFSWKLKELIMWCEPPRI